MNQELSLEQWQEQEKKEVISVEDLNSLSERYALAKKDYDEKKKLSSEANELVEMLKAELLEKLKKSGLKKFHSSVGLVSTTHKFSVTTPKTIDEKRALLEHFRIQGEDVFYTYASVNSQTLNSYYNKMSEEAAMRGETFTLPGVGEPTIIENISFRKA